MRRFLLLSLVVIAFFSCDKKEDSASFNYPDSKVWKHGVYSKYDAQKYEDIFDGLEVDVIYSQEKNDIYVGRVVADTSKNLTLNEWLSVLKQPEKMNYWIDFKNLSEKNVESSMIILDNLNKKYRFKDNAFVESKNLKVLKIVKDHGFRTLLWVENIKYWKRKEHKDSVYLAKMIRNQIKELNPDAISCEYSMYPFLCDSFPEQNIHFWDTPKDFTPENVEFTKKLCNNKSVKVVLVDYPTPDIF